MLKLTKLDQRLIAINPLMVVWLEETPDTVIVMVGGQRIIVREKANEVIEAFIRFHERVGRTPVVVHEQELAAALPPGRSSTRPHSGDF